MFTILMHYAVTITVHFFPCIIVAREDYTSISEIVEFLPGQTDRHIFVQINNDMRIEDNETFQLYLIAGAGVNLTPLPRTEVTIENDDGESNHAHTEDMLRTSHTQETPKWLAPNHIY